MQPQAQVPRYLRFEPNRKSDRLERSVHASRSTSRPLSRPASLELEPSLIQREGRGLSLGRFKGGKTESVKLLVQRSITLSFICWQSLAARWFCWVVVCPSHVIGCLATSRVSGYLPLVQYDTLVVAEQQRTDIFSLASLPSRT